jgi:hypothetical protein
MSYLASEHDREWAVLYGRDGEEVRQLSRGEAVEELGGKNVEYRETIVSLSEAECRALEARSGGDKEVAQREAARGLGERLSEGKAYVSAVHEEGNRWHLHVCVKDSERPGMYGPRGEAQKAFDDFWRSGQPRDRIVDWDAHARAKNLQTEVRSITEDLRRLERDRYQAVRSAGSPMEKLRTANQYENKARELVTLRHQVDRAAIEARYQARGTKGSWEQKVDQERAQIKRSGAENRIQRREEKLQERLTGRSRPECLAARSTDRTLAQGRERLIRGSQGAVQAASKAAAQAIRSIAKTALPRDLQAVTKLAAVARGDGSSAAMTLARTAAIAHQALNVAIKAADLVQGATRVLSALTKEVER